MHSPKRESPLVIFLKAFPPHMIGVMVAQIAIVNGVLMIGAVFLGLALDRQFGTRPALTLALPILGAILSVWVAYRMAMRTVHSSRKAYLNWVESQQLKDVAEHKSPDASMTQGATVATATATATANDAH